MVEFFRSSNPSYASQLLSGLEKGYGKENNLSNALQVEKFKAAEKQKLQAQKLEAIQKLIGGGDTFSEKGEQLAGKKNAIQGKSEQGFDPAEISDSAILGLEAIDPNLGRTLAHLKETAIKKQVETKKGERKEFTEERKFHTELAKPTIQKAENLRDTIDKKATALDLAQEAYQSGNLGYFSPDKLANITGQDVFRTAKGAQLITAGKENLLNNMSRVSARAQNIWFEQRLNSMFPLIGQSREANATVSEMLQGELEMDKAWLSNYDRLAAEDESKYGYIRKDINKRADEASKGQFKQISDRINYRLREIEENEKYGKDDKRAAKAQVGKNVSKGTPLTIRMARLYREKFGDKALEVAKKNGYSIPTYEEVQEFIKTPSEYRESL